MTQPDLFTRMHMHSLENWERIKEGLSARRFQIYKLIVDEYCDNENRLTLYDIAKILDVRVNTISGRIGELKKQGMIETWGEKIINGFAWDRFRPTGNDTPKPLEKEKRQQSKEDLLKEYRTACISTFANEPYPGELKAFEQELEAKILDRIR